MSEKTKRFPPWRRVRQALQPIASLPAIPAWLTLGAWFYSLLEFAHLASWLEDIRRGAHLDPVNFLQTWGWLIGILWLAGVVIWAAMRPSAVQREHDLGRLRNTLVNAAMKFAALQRSHMIDRRSEPQSTEAMREFALALCSFAVAAYATLPAESWKEYVDMLAGVESDLAEFHREEFWLVSAVRAAIRQAQTPTSSPSQTD